VTAPSAYVIGVVSEPLDEAAPDGIETYTLAVPSTGILAKSRRASLHHAEAAGPEGDPVEQGDTAVDTDDAVGASQRDMGGDDADYWRSRIGLANHRRAGIARLVRGLRAGTRSLAGVAKKTTCAPACDTNTMCWQGSCVDQASLVVADTGKTPTMTLIDVVSFGNLQVNVLIDPNDDTPTARQAARDAVNGFGATWADELTILGRTGHEGPLDHDEDGRLTVAFTNASGGSVTGVVGFFWFPDVLPASDGDATGNEMDILWARVPGTGTTTLARSVGTLAHEYTHLVSYAARVVEKNNAALREAAWLDEGIAHLMEDLTGNMASNIRTVEEGLEFWPEGGFATGEDSIPQRGRAYALLRHQVDMAGKALCAADAGSPEMVQAAATVVSELIQEEALGFEHARFRQAGEDAVWRPMLALFTTGNNEVTFAPAHSFDFLPVGSLGGNTVGLAPRGSYTDDQGASVTLTGPNTEEFFADDGDIDSEVYLGGSMFWSVEDYDASQLTLTHDDPAVPAALWRQRVK
jgi:hypothetical protein